MPSCQPQLAVTTIIYRKIVRHRVVNLQNNFIYKTVLNKIKYKIKTKQILILDGLKNFLLCSYKQCWGTFVICFVEVE